MAVDSAYILEQLRTNPVWQVRVLGKKWVSPYDGMIGATWKDQPEEMVDEVLRFLNEESTDFDEGRGSTKTLGELYEIKLQHEVKQQLRNEPAWRIKDRQNRWIDPYTGTVTNIIIEDDKPLTRQKFQEVIDHLRSVPEFENGEGETKPVAYLRARQKFLDSENWHVTGPNGHWVSPYTAKEIETVPWGDGADKEKSWEAIWHHLQIDRAFNHGEGKERPMQELNRNVERGERQNQLVQGVMARFSNQMNWQRFDVRGLWVCPFCGATVGNVKPPMENDSQQRMSAVTIAKHLLYACQPYQELSRGKGPEELSPLLDQAPEGETAEPIASDSGNWENTVIHHPDAADGTPGSVAEEAYAEAVAVDAEPVSEYAEATPVDDDPFNAAISAAAEPAAKPGVPEPSNPRITGGMTMQQNPHQHEHDKVFEEARRKQLRMLPEPPEIEGMECAVVYQPADMVGGDFYDFVQLRNGQLGVVQGDVSGHGLEVWGDMTMAMKTLRIYARNSDNARDMLISSNEDLVPDLMAKTFVSAFYSIIDTESFKMKMARAGHNPLIVFNPDRKPQPLMTYEPKGMVLGMAGGTMFQNTLEEIEIQLYSGDMLVWYTDGITETMDAEGEEWGLDRLCAVIEQNGRREAEYLLQMIQKELDLFRGECPVDDDITLIAVKVI